MVHNIAASSWEMSFFAPHSVATLVRLMGGNDTFVQRVPDLTASRVRQIVYKNFNTGIGGDEAIAHRFTFCVILHAYE
ncbi:hypothetical protein MPER_10457 [Moniliophthora perniciosa FA553]|nr:hypothetical protein MPER_10457 [Moniliophthora perniciosa FA553]